jgi:hypothetical protein
VFEPCVGAPILKVNLAQAPNDQLQLTLVEALEQGLGHKLVET